MVRHIFALVFSLLVGTFVLYPAVFAQDTAPKKDSESVCLKATRCDARNFNKCSTYNTEPLVRVHRAHLELQDQLKGTELYIEECFEVPGMTDDFCVPYPIVKVGNVWKIKNYLEETPHDYLPWDGANGVRDLVKNTLMQMCIAAFVNPGQGELECDPIYKPGGSYYAEQNWELGDRFLTEHEYAFHGLYQGVATPADGLTGITDFPATGARGTTYEWGSSTGDAITRSFRAIAFSLPQSGTSGSDPSNKVGQLGFTVGEGTCESTVNYDPFGRVFASSNLEPIQDAKVALYRLISPTPPDTGSPTYRLVTRSNTQIVGYAFRNPQPSGALGYFSFAVPPGTYKLLALRPNESAPTELGDVLSSASPMDTDASRFGQAITIMVTGGQYTLYPEVYQVGTDGTNVLLPEIIEGEEMERRDVALSGMTASTARVLKLKRTTSWNGDATVKGRINKPFGIATLRRSSDDAVVGTATADGDGYFTVIIPQYNNSGLILRPGDRIIASAASVPLVQVLPTSMPHVMVERILALFRRFFDHEVQAQAVTGEMSLPPRLNYLEGYAYDSTGALLKDAEVTIFDKSLGLPVYTTMTDEKGYYRVSSEHLPRNDYLIWYKPAGSQSLISIEADEFYEQNAEYIETEEIDVLRPQYGTEAQVYLTQHPEPTKGVTGGSMVDVKPGVSGMPYDASPPDRPGVTDDVVVQRVSPTLLMYVAILLMLIVGAGLLILFYLKRRQEPHLYE